MADLGLLLGQLHVVEDPEDNSEQVLPPVFLKGVSVRLHHFEHHGQAPGTQTHTVGIGSMSPNDPLTKTTLKCWRNDEKRFCSCWTTFFFL